MGQPQHPQQGCQGQGEIPLPPEPKKQKGPHGISVAWTTHEDSGSVRWAIGLVSTLDQPRLWPCTGAMCSLSDD